MTTHYTIKKSTELTTQEINTILQYWEIEAWMQMTEEEFRHAFKDSAFHLLTYNGSEILCLARINFDFSIQVGQQLYRIAELVGLVAAEKGKGYGKALIGHIRDYVENRQIEVIGFCEKELRPFYQKCDVPILYDQAKQLREKKGNEWVSSTDDDVLIIHLSEDSIRLFNSLNTQNLGYLVFSHLLI
jgi:GNAT superfamily N-acetyltransferase